MILPKLVLNAEAVPLNKSLEDDKMDEKDAGAQRRSLCTPTPIVDDYTVLCARMANGCRRRCYSQIDLQLHLSKP